MVHGFLSSAVTYVANGKNSLAYRLCDEGYDIWLANSRGNKYSRKHKYLDPDRDAAKFFNFDW